MNSLSKFGCRVYQTAFHAALPVLPYREPELHDSVDDIQSITAKLGARSALLVTDSFLRTSGVTRRLEENLAKAGVKLAVYDRTCPNPTVQNVEEARELYVREQCECLIAVGGGSSIDCAKAVGTRIAWPKRTLDSLRGNLRIMKRLPPLIAIPTTAGTGSEATLTAVITDPENHYKYTMNDFSLIPRYAILDPEMTFTLPPSLTATTGMDALTHAVEVFIGRSTSKETRAWALEATRLIFENIEIAYHDGQNREARKNMLRAAYLAGNAFSKSYVGYIHAVAHSLGGQYNIPHGLANTVLMPIVLEDYGAAIHEKLRQLAIAAGVAKESDAPEQAAAQFIAAIREKNRRMNIPETLSGIQAQDIPTMARHAAKEANPLYPVPVLMDAKQLERYYRMVSGEKQ